MRLLPSLLCLLVILHSSYAPPVTQDKSKEQESEVKDDLEEYMEYHRYLKEVVQALESDPDFRERLEKADEEDVRSGKIAEQLDFVNHNVRTKLDEIKRREMERLRHLATKQYELTNNLDTDMGKVPSNEHLDHANPHTFEIEDLKKLIKKTTADLEAADKQRRQQFKEYEMQKEFEKHQKLENMDEAQKKEYAEKMKAEEDAKKHHKRLHHPVTREQLLEFWKTADHMDAKDFDPKVFFVMHDVDGNGVWDADEVKALFIKELDKLYGPGGPNKDLHERAEEMERMREHVFQQNDHNRDGLIDFQEFLSETKKEAFNQDEGWKPIEENQIYTQAEYQEYEKRMREGLRYLQERGLVDAHGRPVPGAHIPPEYYQQNQAYMQQQQHFQGQMPPQYHGQPQTYQQPQAAQGINTGRQSYDVPQIYQQSHPKPGEYIDSQGQYPGGPAQQGVYPGQNINLNQAYAPPNQQMPSVQGQNQQGQGQIQQGQASPMQGQPQIQSQAQAPQRQIPINQGQTQQVQGQVQQGQGQAQADQGQPQLGQGQVQLGQVQTHLGQGQAQPGQVQAQQIQGQQPLQQTQNQGQSPPIQTQN